MTDFNERIAKLSPDARAILERRLKGMDLSAAHELIRRRIERNSAPLSFGQQRLWVRDRLEPGKPYFNIAQAIRIRGPLDVKALDQALHTIRERHEVLRTVFVLEEGEPVQRVMALEPTAIPVVELRTDRKRDAELMRIVQTEASTPFDLARGPLLRATLVRLGDEEHVLLVTVHHIVFDGWSGDIFYSELATLYESYAAGDESSLSPLPIQYADFAIWQRDWLRGAVLEESVSYWKKQLDGAPAVLDLPTNRHRPPVQTFRGATETVVFSKDLLDSLRALGQRDGATLFMTLLTAFDVLLMRYSGCEDVLVGSPVAGRNRSDIEGLVGFFVNTLVFRANLSGDPSFRELLRRVRDVAVGAYVHENLPFEKLVEEINPERTLSHSPLIQVMMNFQMASGGQPRLGSLSLTPIGVASETANYDLTLSFVHMPTGLRAALQYDTDLFESWMARGMLTHLEVLLKAVVEDPDRRLSELTLLTSAERQKLLVGWNQTDVEYPREKTLTRLFEEQVARTPDAVAIEFDGKRLTYGELNGRANQLARHLRGLGVGPEVLVGLYTERSLEMVVGLFGILKAGGAYLPLDPNYPDERAAFMLEDAQPPVVVTERRLARRLSSSARAVLLDAEWDRISKNDAGNTASGVLPENPAYVLYTSGSSGRPKGVAVPHRAVVNFLASMQAQPGLGPRDKLLAVTTLSFDIAGLEIYLPLTVGASIVLASREVASSGSSLIEALTTSGATVMQATPATWQMMLEAGWNNRSDLRILCGGEALPRELANQLLARGTSVWNLYGPTETTIWSTLYKLSPGEEGAVPIGRPIANTRIYLLDSNRQPVPVGVPGEIYIGGNGVARGYLHRPELTAEKFVADPFSADPEMRLYRTGDRGRYRPDGNIEYVGRVDEQVKLRGFRVEPGEIEAALLAHPAVREAVVVVREIAGDRRLVAYLVGDPEQVPRPADLRAFLKRSLPDPMVPSVFVSLDALPRTPNGKVDRKSLPEPGPVRPELERRYVAPRDSFELQLTQIWEKVLGEPSIGIFDNFFDLGGHSLLAVRLFARIKKEFGRELPLATIFQAATVEQLAAILREGDWSARWISLVPMQPGGSRPPLYLIHAGGGNVLFYADLVRYLGPDQPVYGLQAKAFIANETRPERLEEMASDYVKEIRELQPEGPYYLGGASYGGMIAFEMAQQLIRQRHDVNLVALFDTWGPDYPRQRPDERSTGVRLKRISERIGLHVGNILAAKGLKLKTRYVVWKASVLFENHRIAFSHRFARIRKALGVPRALRLLELRIGEAKSRYVPQVYPGRLTLFRATKQPSGFGEERALGWPRVAGGGVEVYDVPGHHGAIVHEPRVSILAEQLTRCLQESQAGGRRVSEAPSGAGEGTWRAPQQAIRP